MNYTGINGKKYLLGEELGQGGEGIIYEIKSQPDLVAKIYKDGKFANSAGTSREKQERKLRCMVRRNLQTNINGHSWFVWPVDVLYEEKKMMGFVMQKVSCKYKIFDMYRTGEQRKKKFPGYTWKYGIQTAYNLAYAVCLMHSNGIVVGDLNMNNIMLDQNGLVTLIDCDSFDLTDPVTGEHFPCEVGLPELLAPELQTVSNLAFARFTKETDSFSLGILIFRLLMENRDPFGMKLSPTDKASQIAGAGDQRIINGDCYYVKKAFFNKLPPRSPRLSDLPPEIVVLMERTFSYSQNTILRASRNRPTALEWCNALYPIGAEPGINGHLKKCIHGHIYAAHNRYCPWCRIGMR